MGHDTESSLREEDIHLGNEQPTICKIPRATFLVCLASMILAFAVIAVSMVVMHDALPSFHELVEVQNIMAHLEAFQKIADENGGSRGISHGYNASIEYVIQKLKEETNLQVEVQEFPVKIFHLNAEPSLAIHSEEAGDWIPAPAESFKALMYSGSGEVQATLTYALNSGCTHDDFANVTTGTIALISRGGCTFAEKVSLAISHEAVGVVIVSEGDVFSGTLGADSDFDVPVIAVSSSLGIQLTTLPPTTMVTLTVDAAIEISVAKNILASTRHGSEENVVIVGAHLDSVKEGPGINDNGSGSASNLEIAITYSSTGEKAKNKVVFAWWGAEENGLVGSTHYVEKLKESGAISKVAAYINMDMIGSPNFIRGVYNGSEAEGPARVGSEVILGLFEEHFEAHELEAELVPFNGRSDYGAFLKAGIPSGGVFSGGEELKTMEQRKMFGGLAKVPFDPCYHTSCDSLENINEQALHEMSRAVARVFHFLASHSNIRKKLEGEEGEEGA